MSIKPGQYDFPVTVRGDSFGNIVNGTAIGYAFTVNLDLSGYEVSMWIRQPGSYDGAQKKLSSSPGGGITIEGPVAAGVWKFTLVPFIANLVHGINYYDIQLKAPDGTIITILSGKVPILNDITK